MNAIVLNPETSSFHNAPASPVLPMPAQSLPQGWQLLPQPFDRRNYDNPFLDFEAPEWLTKMAKNTEEDS